MTIFNYLLLILLIIIWILYKNLSLQTQGVQFFQGDHKLLNKNYYIDYMKLEKLTKLELVKRIKELDSKNFLDYSKVNKLAIKDLWKLCIKILSNLFNNFIKLFTKISLFSIFFTLFSKFKVIKYIWNIFYLFLVSIFGVAISDTYGFKVIFEEFINYWDKYIIFIQETKFYQIISKILTSYKSIEETGSIKTEEIQIDEEIKKESVSNQYWKSDENKITSIEDNRQNIRDTSEVDSFYYNKYFIITISIISLSLIYYYWDNINDLGVKIIDKIKGIRPGDDSDTATIRPDNSASSPISDIEVVDLTSIADTHEKLSRETLSLINKINKETRYLDLYKDTITKNSKIEITTNLIKLFEDLKSKYNENANIFNEMIKLNTENNSEVFSSENKIQFIKNINAIEKVLNTSYDVIPDYNLNLSELQILNLERPTSPELVASTSSLHDLNSIAQESWKESSTSSTFSSPKSDRSDITINKPASDLSKNINEQ